MIPEEVVDQVMQSADIVAIVGEHVKLKRTGSSFRGPCPFHQGTGPNFSVTPGRGYHCFVCHEKGTVFTFVQKRLGLSFVEAVKYVGEKAGIEVRDVQRKREGPDPREPFWEINATVAAWFRTMLWEGDSGRAAREYLAGRQLSRETAEAFGLGYAPQEMGLMRAYLNGLGFDDERLLLAGLLTKREEQDEPRPRFRDRLIFPILDATGHTVGFGGRLLGPGEPKYLNTAENPAFSKGRLLYNFSQARHAIRREERVILVEGYFDAARMAAAGFEEVVAPMGTALTTEQAELIARTNPTVFLLYDSDAPGQKASFRASDVLLGHGLRVRMVTLPPGEDPDTFVAGKGKAAMDTLLGQSLDVFDRKIQLLERGGWFADLQRKRRALDHLLPTIRSTTDAITRDLYLTRTAEAAGIARDVLVRELELSPRRGGAGAARRAGGVSGRQERGGWGARAQAGPDGRAQADDIPPPDAYADEGEGEAAVARPRPHESSAERELVRVMLLHPEQVERVVEEVGRLDAELDERPAIETMDEAGVQPALRDPVYASIFRALADGAVDAEGLGERLTLLENREVEALRSEPAVVADPGRTIADAVAMLRERLLRERLDEHARMLPLAAEQDKDALLRLGVTLQKELRAVGKREWRSVRRRDW